MKIQSEIFKFLIDNISEYVGKIRDVTPSWWIIPASSPLFTAGNV